MSDDVTLSVDGYPVAEYVVAPDIDARLSPRPYLHPVRTLGGVIVSDVLPEDHPHHLGVSLAVQDVNKSNLWGGKTYVRDTGYTWLDDHGRIEHDGFGAPDDDRLVERLRWCDSGGETLLDEEREISAAALAEHPGAWTLTFAYTLTAAREVALGSPATNGRPGGAGYGGFFWRAALSDDLPTVFTEAAAGEDQANGSTESWLAMATDHWTLVFTGLGDADHWFVRAAGYPGVCAALAFEQPRAIREGGTIGRRHRVVVADGRLPRTAIAGLVDDLPRVTTPERPR